MKSVIFLGPSLPLDEASQVLDAIYLPPAAQSDLLSAVTTYQPDVIGLIDGVFRESLSVWHKEILYALERGVRVYGASSMGALRAAETDVFGMVGVGEVYRQFASGELTDDDEVALIHTDRDDGYMPLSEAMVNIRATLQRAVDEGVIGEDIRSTLVTIGKELYFPARTFPTLLERGRAAGIPEDVTERLRAFVATSYVDQKREDAIALLRTVRDLREAEVDPLSEFTMTRSHLFDAQYDRDRTVRHRNIDVPLASIVDYTALHATDFNELNFAAMNRRLVTILAALLDVEVTDNDIAQEARRFGVKHELTSDDTLAAWLRDNDLSTEEFAELMREMALCRRMHRWLLVRQHFERNTKIVLDELRLRDRYVEAADDTAEQERVLRDHFLYSHDAPGDNGTWQQLVLEHLRATGCKMEVVAPVWAEEAGFRDLGEMLIELQRARLARHHRRDLMARLLEGMEATSEPAGSSQGTGGS